jgi:hypothetical protein
MRAKEFIKKEDNQLSEIAPIIGALGSAVARGAMSAGNILAKGVGQIGSTLAQGAAQLGKQAVGSAANAIGTSVANKLIGTGQQTTSTTQPPQPLQPADLTKLRGRSVPTDLGQLKVGNINPQGLELTVDPKSKLAGIVGDKITIPVK